MSTDEILFLPKSGCVRYTPEDIKYISTQQPISMNAIPIYLLEQPAPGLIPPKLWFGWRLGTEELVRVALEKLPDAVTFDHWTGDVHYVETLANGRLLSAICQACQIPEEYADLLDIVSAVRPGTSLPRHDIDMVLSVGSTRAGLMPEEVWERVGRMFADGADPQFHLDSWRWFWSYTPDDESDEEDP
ncbi:hypothetical protein K488DRAFT_89585 [Vararia minispora EC-137]|uniref:Uncharacterized protein n=1 Tax=Vararia minispora EC-137 TaxID=1314806 RepID=A0ACB8QA60_9AGAM|nr:hypothetical protein K488DRAFT_89585 [Vararia minispora EC-137]